MARSSGRAAVPLPATLGSTALNGLLDGMRVVELARVLAGPLPDKCWPRWVQTPSKSSRLQVIPRAG
jgi:hypothetical protein